MAVSLGFLFAYIARLRRRLYDQVAEFLVKRGWERSLGIPDSAISILIATEFRVDADWSDYTCAHAFRANAATLYLALTTMGGRNEKANTVILETGDLRSPIECLVATDSQAPEAFLPSLYTFRLRSGAESGRDLYLHFHSHPSAEDARFAKTVRIVELVFHGAESVFTGGSIAVLGPKGMFVRGPSLGLDDKDEKVAASLEPLVKGAEHLLDRCEAVWKENNG